MYCSACPVRARVPIEAAGVIPISQEDVAGIPEVALGIPDFEGQAVLRVFLNSTQREIGCFAAQITNGCSFQQQAAVSTMLGGFTLLAVVSSFATAAYGSDILDMRRHYAHSMSVSVVVGVWQHIFYSGALSMNWPSVLVAFWSNYAWAGGMIYYEPMQNMINDFIGSNKGNTSHVGAAGTGESNPHIGGGIDIHQIYTRKAVPGQVQLQTAALAKRHLVDASTGFKYYGLPLKPGLPLPGNYSGFAGTLATQRIPASNAFMTGLLWLLVLMSCAVVCILGLKAGVECLSSVRIVRQDRITYFRQHYRAYIAGVLLRMVLMSFFMMAFLAMFQFSYLALSGPVAVACVVFVAVVFGVGSVAAYACFSRLRLGKYVSEPDRLNVAKRRLFRMIPWCSISRDSERPRSEDNVYLCSMPWWRIHATAECTWMHSDEGYTAKFGWLASRYRRRRWWFFVVWLFYEFFRAGFLAGASSEPMVQVFGLLAIEAIAFVMFMVLRPFEGQRLNAMGVYLLGFSKVSTTALSAALDARFGLGRIPATVIGIVIIVIQGLLTVALMVLVLIGAASSYMSVVRNRTEIRPRSWNPSREKYFGHMESAEQDVGRPSPRRVSVHSMPEVPRAPYFEVKQVKRMAKIEDEDDEFMEEIKREPLANQLHGRPGQGSRRGSVQSRASSSSFPRAARLHRASWSTQDYHDATGRRRDRALSSTSTSTRLGEDTEMKPSTSASGASRRTETPVMGHEESRAASRLTCMSRASWRPRLEASMREEDVASPRR